LLVGLEVSDDAAVYQVSDELAVVATVDFFPPVVDDPYDYGAIAAANAMSDVYAMGGEVVLALNVAAFPAELPAGIVSEILRGGAEKVREAGGVLAGGHTINDKEPKYGMAVIGFVHPERVLTKAGARPGDTLVLTKPLGVGIITTALKGEKAQPSQVAAAVKGMKQLNQRAARVAQQVGVHGCTDITGFALLGHSLEMAEKSGVQLRFRASQLPFHEGAETYAAAGLFPGGTCNNERAYQHAVRFASGVSEEMRQLLYTPETSGGLLIAVPQERVEELTTLFSEEGQDYWIVGEVVEGEGIEVLE
jgi:selenide,water dikinase